MNTAHQCSTRRPTKANRLDELGGALDAGRRAQGAGRRAQGASKRRRMGRVAFFKGKGGSGYEGAF